MRATVNRRLRGTPIKIMTIAMQAWAMVTAEWILLKILEQSDSVPFCCSRQLFILLVITYYNR